MLQLRVALISLLIICGCGQTAQPAPEETGATAAPAAAPDKRGVAEAEIGGAKVKIDYGRPALKGRDMLSQLPEGGVWRLGMDQATGLETSSKLAFGETAIEPGGYTLFVRKEAGGGWTLLVNSQTGIWGTQHDAASDIAEIPLETSQLDSSVEYFTAEVRSTGEKTGELAFQWATLQLKAPFEVAG